MNVRLFLTVDTGDGRLTYSMDVRPEVFPRVPAVGDEYLALTKYLNHLPALRVQRVLFSGQDAQVHFEPVADHGDALLRTLADHGWLIDQA